MDSPLRTGLDREGAVRQLEPITSGQNKKCETGSPVREKQQRSMSVSGVSDFAGVRIRFCSAGAAQSAFGQDCGHEHPQAVHCRSPFSSIGRGGAKRCGGHCGTLERVQPHGMRRGPQCLEGSLVFACSLQSAEQIAPITAAFPRTTAGPATLNRRSRRGCRLRPGQVRPPRRSPAPPRRRRPGPRSRGCALNQNPWP
jgi:hypothetical protein